MHHAPAGIADNAAMLLSAVGVHTLSFLLVTGIVAVIVYEVVGLALLRKAWFNMDLLWSIALMIAGVVILFLETLVTGLLGFALSIYRSRYWRTAVLATQGH